MLQFIAMVSRIDNSGIILKVIIKMIFCNYLMQGSFGRKGVSMGRMGRKGVSMAEITLHPILKICFHMKFAFSSW